MAVRLYSEFKSDRGILYRIEIHDTEWVAASTTFKVDSRGFELTYDGETDDIVSPIVGSKLTFGAYSENGTFETFVDLLKTFQENRFRVVVYRPDTNWESWAEFWQNAITPWDENDLFWVGWIIQDLVSLEDESQPYVYSITAADGLGRLANIDYTANNDLAAGLTRVSDVVGNCIDFAGITDLWGADDIYLETSVNWWETTIQTYATTKDTIEEHAIDILVFRGEDGDGNTTYSKAYDVLKELCITYGARIYQSNGRWIFEQYVNRANTPRIVSLYDKTITRLSTSSRADDITIDQTNGFARLAGAQFNFLPAVGSVSVDYARDKFNAISQPYTFKSTAPTKTLGIIGASTATQLKFYGPHNYNITSNTGVTTNDDTIAVVWRMQIRIESATTAGLFYYYNRAFNGFATAPVYGAAAWSTTAGYYYYHSPFAKVAFGAVSINAAPVVITSNLPTSGTLRITSEHYGNFLPLDGTTYTLAGHQTDTWLTTLTIVRMDNANDDSVSVTYRANNANANVNSKIELQLGTTRIANGLFQTGDLSVFNGTTFVSGISFRRGPSGAGNQILNLLTMEMLGLHAVPVERFNGQFFTAESFEKRFIFDGGYWVNIGGTFTANDDQWSGEWFRIDYAPANIGTISETPRALTTAVNGGSNIANDDGVIEVGRVGGMAVDSSEERIGPYEQTATGGRINGTANVTGATTLSTTLGVTGATTLSSTLGVTGATTLSSTLGVTGAATMNAATINGTATLNAKSVVNGSWNANIRDVDAGAGADYSVEEPDYILFLNYTGGNGTFTIYLPPVATNEGRMIRVKTDSTISATKKIELKPDGGDTGATIDGEAASTMNRPYDGATYLCHDGDWYVIQKKEK